MGFFDNVSLPDLSGSAQDQVDQVGDSIVNFLGNTVKAELVKLGPQPAGNLSQAQLNAGQVGNRVDAGVKKAAAISVPVLIAIGVAVYFLAKRR